MEVTGEMQIADAELGALDQHGQVDFAPSRQILDIAVAAVLGAARDGASAVAADLLRECLIGAAAVDVGRVRGLGHDTVERASRDQFLFPLVPCCQHFMRRRAAQDARVDQAGESDVRNVTRGAEDAFEIPDGFGTG